jgi:gliding motility-associated lipoprotein GldD
MIFYIMLKIRNITLLWLFSFVIIALLFNSCGKATVPRPYGYFRVDLPPHTYRKVDTLNLPYKFELSKNAVLVSREVKGENFWIDLYYPKLNAGIYCSYKPVNGNLIDLVEDTRKIVYKHSVKADGIGERVYDHKENNVHGILYDLKGNTASNVQFILTDSTRHFFRGALYFNNVPNKDSIAPMSDYIREDIMHLMESFEWRK